MRRPPLRQAPFCLGFMAMPFPRAEAVSSALALPCSHHVTSGSGELAPDLLATAGSGGFPPVQRLSVGSLPSFSALRFRPEKPGPHLRDGGLALPDGCLGFPPMALRCSLAYTPPRPAAPAPGPPCLFAGSALLLCPQQTIIPCQLVIFTWSFQSPRRHDGLKATDCMCPAGGCTSLRALVPSPPQEQELSLPSF